MWGVSPDSYRVTRSHASSLVLVSNVYNYLIKNAPFLGAFFIFILIVVPDSVVPFGNPNSGDMFAPVACNVPVIAFPVPAV